MLYFPPTRPFTFGGRGDAVVEKRHQIRDLREGGLVALSTLYIFDVTPLRVRVFCGIIIDGGVLLCLIRELAWGDACTRQAQVICEIAPAQRSVIMSLGAGVKKHNA